MLIKKAKSAIGERFMATSNLNQTILKSNILRILKKYLKIILALLFAMYYNRISDRAITIE